MHNLLNSLFIAFLLILLILPIDIIVKRFGFDGNEPMKLEEIGNEYNVTRERVRQIQTVALHKLGRMIRKSKDTMI